MIDKFDLTKQKLCKLNLIEKTYASLFLSASSCSSSSSLLQEGYSWMLFRPLLKSMRMFSKVLFCFVFQVKYNLGENLSKQHMGTSFILFYDINPSSQLVHSLQIIIVNGDFYNYILQAPKLMWASVYYSVGRMFYKKPHVIN